MFKLLKLIFIVCIFMFFSGLLSFCRLYSHFLLMLLSLKFMMLSLFLCFFCYLMSFTYSLYCLIIFLVFMVCEGVLGISLLIKMIRCHGNDNLLSFKF
uniref:NADH-ubiquinone oxidoreductase chain 4L n=1 Tax=Polytoxus fuscovittatus TaxID=1347745 RepID=A0A7I6HJQ0_9HEMI|nr:NADH dehydrogenase subunit 4L [Polytoxus fuscovittatus]